MEVSKRAILVVEGDAESREALCRLLQAEFEVYAAADASEALELLRQQSVHVIVAGQRLPETTGMALLDRVQQQWPATIRVALAGYCDLKAVIDASEPVGLFGYLTKPCDADETRRLLRQACRRYEENAAQEELLARLRRYQMECLQLLDGLRHGMLGELSREGQAKVKELSAIGGVLLDSLDGTLNMEPGCEAMWPESLPAWNPPFPCSTEPIADAAHGRGVSMTMMESASAVTSLRRSPGGRRRHSAPRMSRAASGIDRRRLAR